MPFESFEVEINVTNNASAIMDAVIIASYDKDNVLVELYYMYADVEFGKDVTFGALIKNINNNVERVCAMVKENLSDDEPLAEAVNVYR